MSGAGSRWMGADGELEVPRSGQNNAFAFTPTKPDKAVADPRLVFLHRAHARLILFENGLLDLDEAVFGLLDDYCPCSPKRRSK